ncbi:hypothetical protein QT234_18190 (plasmid) [Geobacillus stearothermophilus]|nr:hypothetical protein QT234_18215 [Geobacillus stearothermophilus]WJQ02176.1 hypothetical protein QT234_18190 [Geobacillus stearothermophilus]
MLSQFQKRYEDIMSGDMSRQERNRRLAALMTEMEQVFQIPLVRNEEWERRHKAIIALYRKISLSRRFSEDEEDEYGMGECRLCGNTDWVDYRCLCEKCRFIFDVDFADDAEDIYAVYVCDEGRNFDAVVLHNETWFGVESKEELEMFLEGNGYKLSDWSGIPWSEIEPIPDIRVVARRLGEPLAYYDKSGRLHVLDMDKLEQRKVYWSQMVD